MFRYIRFAWDSFKEYIVFVLILIISLILIAQNDSQSVKKFRTFVFGSYAATSSVFSDLFSFTSLKSEVKYLRGRNAELMMEVSKLREYAFTNDELNRLIKFRDTSSYQLIPASVVYKSITGIQVNFALNKGTSEGIRQGCPVITGDGLVGIVQMVSSNYSIVRTLRNSDLKLIVRNERSRIDGILKFNGNDIMISNLPKTADIKVGDRIVTSNYSSLVSFPILIGRVKKIVNPEQGSMNNVIIIPSVNFDKTENVFIILNTSTVNFTLPSQITSSAN